MSINTTWERRRLGQCRIVFFGEAKLLECGSLLPLFNGKTLKKRAKKTLDTHLFLVFLG
jgi:hypothetical protein